MSVDEDKLIIKDNYLKSRNSSNAKIVNRNICLGEEIKDDIIKAIFVVAFDYKKGNILEWCMPGDINYSGIEFKALVSGSHLVKTDFMYFRHLSYFGIGCYAMRRLEESEGERGVRMKTVGILSSSYLNLHNYIGFLESSVRRLLINPGNYDSLVAFYSDQIHNFNERSITRSLDLDNIEVNIMPQFDYNLFFQRFGVKIFSLWKLVLLRKRILFLSKPPIGPICQQVLCCHQLGSHDIAQFNYLRSRPLFNISLSDTDSITPSFWQQSFVACTTDQVFQMKKSFYDCLVDHDILQIVNDEDGIIQRAISVSNSDKEKYDKLMTIKNSFDFENNNLEDCLKSFFKSENNRLFHALLDMNSSGEQEITSSHVEYLGFHPKDDKDFLILLLETYGIDLILQIDGYCC